MMRNMLMTAITITALGNVAAADNDPAKKAPETHTPYRTGVNHAPQAVLAGRTARPMRYTPEDGGFVITNGDERFKRPLYIGRGGARFDAGDRPEFAFYLPGKGGVLRLGIAAGDQAKWLSDADTVSARFAEGRMTYTVRDALLGDGEWTIDAVPADDRIAALVRVEQTGGETVGVLQARASDASAITFGFTSGRTDLFEVTNSTNLTVVYGASMGAVGATHYVGVEIANGVATNNMIVAVGVVSSTPSGTLFIFL